MLFGILLQGLFIFLVLATSLPSRNIQPIEKRTSPQIKGYDSLQRTQIKDGLTDALTMAKTVLTADDASVDNILKKYFPIADKSKIVGVFEKITGGESMEYEGAAILRRLTIADDDEDITEEEREDEGVLLNYKSMNAIMVLFPYAFEKGGIDKGYTGVAAVTCQTIGNQLSESMETTGSVILHEFMHWHYLTVPPLSTEADDLDNGYGPYNVRYTVPRDQAIKNADSFTWFAIETFWTKHCSHEFEDPDNCLEYE
ncbi:hypothetical protein N7495_006724 [Penicillium taxi]|uniref:uncharacterized protein n=1 Tax=Penicillium taxi TaxID=168475 RepID=UPI0025458FCD|nr:uncharacterized protein N7495_006724 [Penicillium taxi]KAJ5895033.1 hypothetical protein N7495_006724 [Penicillium taxi]